MGNNERKDVNQVSPSKLFSRIRDLYDKLVHLRQGTQSVHECIEDFCVLTARTDLLETEDLVIRWYHHGLKQNIQLELAFSEL